MISEHNRRGLRTVICVCLSALLFALVPSNLYAQTFRGGITGVVTDASGATIPGAKVTLVSNATGLNRSVDASSAGEFLFQDLPLGVYDISVTQTGFETVKVTGISVEAGRVFNLPVSGAVPASRRSTTPEWSKP